MLKVPAMDLMPTAHKVASLQLSPGHRLRLLASDACGESVVIR